MSYNTDLIYLNNTKNVITTFSLASINVSFDDSPYAVGQFSIVNVDITDGPVVVVLPSDSRVVSFIVSDPADTGNALTVLPGVGRTVDSGATATYTRDQRIVEFYLDGTNWTPLTNTIDTLTPATTRGDLLVYDGTRTVRLPAGSDGYTLIGDSAAPAGVSWTSAGNGDVIGVAPSVNNGIPRYSGIDGKTIRQSAFVISDVGDLSGGTVDGRDVAADGVTIDDLSSITGTLPQTAQWNASRIQGTSVAATAPSDGDFYRYNGTQWTPMTLTATAPLAYSVSTATVSAIVGVAAGTLAAGDDARFTTGQLVRVKKGTPGSGEFSSISAALATIVDATAIKPYVVFVEAGRYIEAPFVIPPFVSVVGRGAIASGIVCAVPSGRAVTMGETTSLANIGIGNVASGGTAVYYGGSVSGNGCIVNTVGFGNCTTCIELYGSVNEAAMTVVGVIIGDLSNVGRFAYVHCNPGVNTLFSVNGLTLKDQDTPYPGTVVEVTGDASRAIINGMLLELNGVDTVGVRVGDGAVVRVIASNIESCHTGIFVASGGAAPSLYVSGCTFSNCKYNLLVEHPDCIGNFNSIVTRSKIYVHPAAPFAISGRDYNIINVASVESDFTSIADAIRFLMPQMTVQLTLNSITATSDTDFNITMNGKAISGVGIQPGTTLTYVDQSTVTLSQPATASGLYTATVTIVDVNDRYAVQVGPGTYTEDTIVMPSYASLLGTANVYLEPADPSNDVLHLGDSISVRNLTIRGATSATGMLLDNSEDIFIENLTVTDCDTCVKLTASASLTSCIVAGLACLGVYTRGIWVDGTLATSSALCYLNMNGGILTSGGAGHIMYFEGPYALVAIGSTSSVSMAGAVGLLVQDGANVFMSSAGFGYASTGISVPAVGLPPRLRLSSVIVSDSLSMDLDIQHPGTGGVISVVAERSKTYVDPSSTVSLTYIDPTVNGLTVVGDLFLGPDNANATESRKMVLQSGPLGVISGGALSTAALLTLNVAAGGGYLENTFHTTQYVEWVATAIVLTANTTVYVYVDEDSVVTANAAIPNVRTNILLGRVRSGPTAIEFIDPIPIGTQHMGNLYDALHREAFGVIVSSGLVVSANVSRELAVTAGVHFYSGNRYVTAGSASPAPFRPYYHVGGVFAYAANETVVDNTMYDDGVDLSAIPAGKYTRHSLYAVGQSVDSTERRFLVYGQTLYDSVIGAIAGDNPTPPTYFVDGVFMSASIIAGDSPTVTVLDQRPTIVTRSNSISSSVGHGNLLGLLADDHPQYLPVDGTRAMAAPLDMGGFDIANAGLVNGVTIAAHASRHLPLGLDPLATAAPLANISAGTANAAGTANSFARSDHSHAVSVAAPVGVSANNAAGVASTLARSDHVHQGVGGMRVNAGTLRFGNVNLVSGTNATVVDDGSNNFTFNASLTAVSDASFSVVDSVDPTIRVQFNAAGTTGTTTTITSSQTAHCTLTLPDATDTLVGQATAATLSNKNLVDTSTHIVDSVTPTIRIGFNAAGTAGTTTTLTSSQTANRTLTLPDTTGTLLADNSTATLSNKNLVDTSTHIVDSVTPTIRIGFNAAGTAGTTTTITSSQTADRALTLPDATDTLVGQAAAATLSNKNLVDASTYIVDSGNATRRIAFDAGGSNSTTTTITSAQTANRTLTLPDATDTLVGQAAAATLSNKSLVDASTLIVDSVDPTIRVAFNAAGTTGTTTTIASSQTADCTLTLPGITDTLVGAAAAATLSNKSLVDASTRIVDDVDPTIRVQFDAAGTTGTTTTIASSQTVDRTLTLPDTTGTLLTDNSTATLSNKSLVDTSTRIVDSVDPTIRVAFSVEGTTGTTTTIASSQTANRTLTLPDATDTLVGQAASATLSNKSLVDASTHIVDDVDPTIRIRFDAAGTTGTTTTIVSSQTVDRTLTLPDTTGTLLADNSTATLSNKNLVDTSTHIVDSVTPTIRIGFDAAGTAGTTTTLTSSQTANRTLTLPDATDTLVGAATAATLSGKSLVDASTRIVDDVDPTIRIRFDAAGTTSTTTTIVSSQTANRTLTLPDTTGTLLADNSTATLSNKNLVDTSTYIVDSVTPTVRIGFDAAGTAGTTTTITSSQTADRALTLPDATDTLVGQAAAATLSNKSLVDASTLIVDSVNATRRIAFDAGGSNSTTTTIAAAQTANRTLTLPDATDTLVGQATAATLSNKSLVDASTLIVDSVDATIRVAFNAAGTTGTTTTITSSQTADRTLTLPNATDTLVGVATAATLSNKNLVDTSTFVVDAVDATVRIGVNASGSSGTTTTITTAQTGNRVITLPDATDTLVGLATTSTLSNKRLVDASTTIVDSVDATRVIQFDAGGSTGTSTTITAAQTGNRVLTLPDLTDTIVSNNSTSTLANKNLVDTTTRVVDSVDPTIRIAFNAAGTTGTTTTVTSSQTTDRVLTLPDTSDTLVAVSATATLANKRLVDASTSIVDSSDSTIRILFDAGGSTGTSTTITAAQTGNRVLTLPDLTDTLVSNNSTSTLANKNLVDTTTRVVDSVDPTIRIAFNAAGTAGTTTTIASSQTSNRVLTLPDATDTLVGVNTAATLTSKQLVDTTTSIVDSVDNTVRIQFNAAGTTGTTTTIASSQTANRVLTLPNLTDNILSDTSVSTLTSKTVLATSNNVAAKSLHSATTIVDVSASAAPTAGQTLVATSGTAATWQTPPYVGNLLPFGSGVDGDVVIAVNTTLGRDMYYNTLTVNVGVVLNTRGYAVYVRGAAVINGAVSSNGNNGGNAASNTAGAAGGGAPPGTLGGGGNGAAGRSNNGSGTAGSAVSNAVGGAGGDGGAGGNSGASGGAAGAPSAANGGREFVTGRTNPFTRLRIITEDTVISGGGGGASGGTDNTNSRASGGGGGGGGVVLFAAMTISGAGSISANGGNAGAPFTVGVVGGSGGGGGGVCYVVTTSITGVSVSANGGAASSGVNGGVSGTNGTNGYSTVLLV